MGKISSRTHCVCFRDLWSKTSGSILYLKSGLTENLFFRLFLLPLPLNFSEKNLWLIVKHSSFILHRQNFINFFPARVSENCADMAIKRYVQCKGRQKKAHKRKKQQSGGKLCKKKSSIMLALLCELRKVTSLYLSSSTWATWKICASDWQAPCSNRKERW